MSPVSQPDPRVARAQRVLATKPNQVTTAEIRSALYGMVEFVGNVAAEPFARQQWQYVSAELDRLAGYVHDAEPRMNRDPRAVLVVLDDELAKLATTARGYLGEP